MEEGEGVGSISSRGCFSAPAILSWRLNLGRGEFFRMFLITHNLQSFFQGSILDVKASNFWTKLAQNFQERLASR